MCRISVNVDETKKNKVKAILKKRGYSMEDAVDMFFDAIIKGNNIPTKVCFTVTYGPYDSVSELREALGI